MFCSCSAKLEDEEVKVNIIYVTQAPEQFSLVKSEILNMMSSKLCKILQRYSFWYQELIQGTAFLYVLLKQ